MKKKLLTAGMAAILVIAAAAGKPLWDRYQAQAAKKEIKKRSETYAELRQDGDISALYDESGGLVIPVEFEELQEKNPDIYAWVTIPGVVDEPILQRPEDDTYYQKHDADEKENTNGAVFTESLNRQDFMDSLTVLYGWNCEDGSLFGNLFRYRDRQFMEEHPWVYIYLPDRILTYRIFAAYQSDNRHLLKRFNQGIYEGNVRAFIKDILGQRAMDASVDRDVDIDTGDRFLTLSTHDLEGEEFRYLVQAYLKETWE